MDYLASEAEGVNYLYSLAHSQNNLFFAKIAGISDSIYRISKISIGSPKLSFEKNNNRFLEFKSGEVPEEVTITWIEDEYRTVEQMHLSWMRSWYNFTGDFIPIGLGNKFKNIIIYAYHYINKNNSLSAPLMDADPVLTLNLINCVPTDLGSGYEFDWSQGGIREFTTTYKFAKVGDVVYHNNYTSNPTPIKNSQGSSIYSYGYGPNLGNNSNRIGPEITSKETGTKPEQAWSGENNTGIPHTYMLYKEQIESTIKNEDSDSKEASSDSTPNTNNEQTSFLERLEGKYTTARDKAQAEKAAREVAAKEKAGENAK